MGLIINLLVTAAAVGITAYVLPGITLAGAVPAIMVAIVLALVNTFLTPIITFLTLPINIVTIGLFTFVINAVIILLVSNLVPGFKVDGFWIALVFSIILSIVNGVLFMIVK